MFASFLTNINVRWVVKIQTLKCFSRSFMSLYLCWLRVLNVDKDERGKTILSVHILEPNYPVEEVELKHM